MVFYSKWKCFVMSDHILSGTICLFCFCTLFSDIYRKINFMAKNGYDLCNFFNKLDFFNNPCGHFVSSLRKREKRDSRGNKREGQGRERNRNENEETQEMKTYLLQGQWLGVAKVSCILCHHGIQLMAYSWARPAILVAGKVRREMFLFLLFLKPRKLSL